MFENRQLDDAMTSVDALQLWPVNPRGLRAAQKREIMGVGMPMVVAVTVAVSASSAQLAP